MSFSGMSCSIPVEFAEEVMVLVDIGIEIQAVGRDYDLPQQAGRGELMKRVVNRRQGHRDCRGNRLLMQLLHGEMPMTGVKQQPRQG